MARKNHATPSSFTKSSLYAAAAKLLTQIIEEKKSFKTLVYSKEGKLQCSKRTYAQVCQVLAYKSILDQVLEQFPGLHEDIRNAGLLHVLLYELLLGPNKAIKGGGVVKRKLMQHEQDLRLALTSNSKIKQQIEDLNSRKQQRYFPRYARVNTILTSTDEICKSLQKEKHDHPSDPYLEFYVDAHVPDLLVFPPSLITNVMNDDKKKSSNDSGTVLSRQQATIRKMIQNGELILQDKSSCFPAFCLVHGFDSSKETEHEHAGYIDACAAPGNKTQHLAALLVSCRTRVGGKKRNLTTTITAMDRSNERLHALSKRMKELVPDKNSPGVKVVTKEADFLESDPKDFADVGSILLDPSCSGSGIYTAPDRWTERNNTTDDTHRVEALAKFQEKALLHAMSFPSVSRIVYSTCSLHDRENEMVVVKALASSLSKDGDDLNSKWRVVAPQCLQQWKRRGHVVDGLNDHDANCMVRACAADGTNGFFVCCLEKIMSRTKEKKTNEGANMSVKDESLIVVPKGLAIYDGQFSKCRPADADHKTLSLEEGKVKTKPEKADQETARPGEIAPDKTEPRNASNKTTSTKRSKKLAWKKRQVEQKQQRLKQKKLKTDHTEKES